MLSEVRMEVLSYEDAIAYCEDNGLIFGYVYEGEGDNAGKFMLLAYEDRPRELSDAELKYYEKQIKLEEKRKIAENESKYAYRLFTYYGESKMYYTGNKNVSPFFEGNALLINKRADAERKALFMNSYKRYTWRIERILK